MLGSLYEPKDVGALLETVVDEMLEGFQIIGPNWQYRYVNETVAKQGKSTKQALIGRTMMECYPGIENTPLFEKMKCTMIEGTSERFDNEFEYPDGTRRCFELLIHPIVEGILILSVDITDRKCAEEKLKDKVHEIEILMGSTTDREAKMAELHIEIAALKSILETEKV